MKIRTTSNAPGYVRKFQRAIVASAIATFLGACAGGTGDETGNGATSGTTPDIGAAVEATVDTDTDSIDIGSGTDVEVTTDTDSTGVDSIVDVSEGVPTDVEAGSTTDTVESPEVDSTTDTVEIPEVDLTASIPDNALGLIQSHPELGLFATAIQSTVLATFLADTNQSVTVFALSDEAFQSLSTTQRDALFEDTTRLETLIKATTIPDRRIARNSAGVVDDMQALTNGKMKLVLEGDVISVATDNLSFMKGSVEIVDSLENDKAVIHVIDDFINIDSAFFPPDPGSIMDRLPEGDYSSFKNLLRYTRWIRELGNSEREWTVFLPADGISVKREVLASHIVARDVNDPILVEAGPLTSVDGSTHMIEDVSGALTIDDIDISELNALQVNNGQVHRIVWPLGEYVSVMDLIEENETYNQHGSNAGSEYRVRFFADLIRSLDETARYDYRDNRVTIVIPEYGITDDEYRQLGGNNYGVDSVRTIYDEYAYMRDNESFAMVPDIFPDTDTARTFLLSHTIEGIVTEETLENGVGSSLQSVAGTQLAITGTTSEGSEGIQNIQLGGQYLSNGTETGRAANGGIITTRTALAETPGFSGSSNSSDVDPSGTGAAALIGDGTAYSEAGGSFLSTAGDGFPESLDNTNGNTDAFMFFVPSNAAMTAATLTDADLTVDDIKRHIATAVTALVDGGTITTVGSPAPTYAVAADADVSGGFTIGGFPVTLLGTTPAGGEIYGIEGILP